MKQSAFFRRAGALFCAAALGLSLAGCSPRNALLTAQEQYHTLLRNFGIGISALFGHSPVPVGSNALNTDTTGTLVVGLNAFTLAPYDLCGQGFEPLLSAVTDRLQLPLGSELAVHSFSALLDRDGRVSQLTLELFCYRGTPAAFDSLVTLTWDSGAQTLDYEPQAPNTTAAAMLATGYNPNLALAVAEQHLAALPITDLCAATGGPVRLSFSAYGRPESGSPAAFLTDGAPAAFSAEQYAAGSYGTADGSPCWLILAQDAARSRSFNLCFAPTDPAQWLGDPDTAQQRDVQVKGDQLLFTRDWGEHWQTLPAAYTQELTDCLRICGGVSRSSWYLSPDATGPAAFLLGGETPVLISRASDAEDWTVVSFPADYPREPNRRMVAFSPDGACYAAISTEWSMGTGGYSGLWRTDAAGVWQQAALPADLPERYPLCGLAAGAGGALLLTAETGSDQNWPDVYASTDAGTSWQPVNLPWNKAEPDGVSFLYRVDALQAAADGSWTARFTQEPTGPKGVDLYADFAADTLTGYWQYLASGVQQS